MTQSEPTATLAPLDPDNEQDAITYEDLEATYNTLSPPRKSYHVGVVLKFLGNRYWQLLADGLHSRADALNMSVDIRASTTENTPDVQRQILQGMMAQNYDAFIVSPQTDDNLSDLVVDIQATGKPVLVINEIVTQARHWTGPSQYQTGILAADYAKRHLPAGSEVAVIQGLADAYAARQRTAGFVAGLEGSGIEIVAIQQCNWDFQMARKAAMEIMAAYPDLQGFYGNNDMMALGVVEAVNEAGRTGDIVIIGTDGIDPAYEAIRAGELTATIDSFPAQTGEIAAEIIARLLEGETLPRVIYTPQQLKTRENIGPVNP